MRTCCRAALLEALHLPLRAHGGHRALILRSRTFGVEQLMPPGAGATRRQFSPTESARRPRSAYRALRAAAQALKVQQRHRHATEDIGRGRAAVREVAFSHGVQEARGVLRSLRRDTLGDLPLDDLPRAWSRRLAQGLANDSGHFTKAERLVRVEIVALVAMARVGQQLGVRLGEIGDRGIDLGIRRCVRVSQRDVSDCPASSFPIRWRSNGALRSSV